MAGCAPGAEFRIDDEFKGELHVIGGDGFAIVPENLVAQTDAPIEPICGNSSVGLVRHLGGQVRHNLALRTDPEQGVED